MVVAAAQGLLILPPILLVQAQMAAAPAQIFPPQIT
jgi:hypothetical protein